jgi:Ca2+-binding RTX toxin-like protein
VVFTLDTAAPTTSVALSKDSGTSSTDKLTNDASLNFGTLEEGATRVITVDGTKVDVYNAAALKDGEHTVTVADTDAAGNTGSASITFMLDTTAPNAGTLGFSGLNDSGVQGDGITNDRDFTLALTGNDAGSTVAYEVSVDGGAFHSTGATQAGLADGNYQFRAIVTDAAGNSATTAAVSVKIDATAPGAPSITAFSDNSGSKGDTITNDNTPTLTITAEADSTVQVFRGGVLVGTATQTAPGSGIYSFTSETLADGSHDFSAKATDAAGNTSAASSVQNVTVDTTPPVPTVALAKDSGASGTDKLTNDASLNFGSLEAGASRVITVDGTKVDVYNAAALKDGEHTVTVSDTDVAGNTGSASITFTLDTKLSAPTVVLANDSGKDGSDGLTNDASLTFSKPDSDATRVITVDGTKVDSYNAASLADGKHTVTVTDTDGAGNTATASVVFTLDTAVPTTSVALNKDSGASNTDKLTNDASLNFGSLEAGASRVITVDGSKVDVYDAAALKDGQHTVTVADTDAAGNTGSKSFTFTLDSQGPVFSSAAGASVAENIGERQVVYRAAAGDDHGVSYSLGGADAARFEIAADGSVTLKENPNYEVKDAYAFTVVATDGAGNHTDRPVVLSIGNVNEAPVATSVAAWTIESAAIGVQIANYVSDPDAGDKLSVQLASNTATLSWANTDAKMSTSLLNPVTHAAVDLGSLTVKASMGADGQLTLTPPAELDWLSDGQFVKASFSYTVTDAGGLSSSESITLLIKGSTNATGVNLSGGNGDDTLSGDANNNAADVLMGNNGNDTLYGYGGTDALYGGNGDDKLYGGAGIDYLYGDNGNDTLDGGSEGDYLFGGKGNDILIGGSGADKFVFAPQNGNDRIMDFNAAEGDMLYFADFFATPPTVDAFLSKYVTDIGSDLQINLTGTTIVLVGVANISDLKGHIAFGNPA